MSTPKLKSTANFGKQKVEGKILSYGLPLFNKDGEGYVYSLQQVWHGRGYYCSTRLLLPDGI